MLYSTNTCLAIIKPKKKLCVGTCSQRAVTLPQLGNCLGRLQGQFGCTLLSGNIPLLYKLYCTFTHDETCMAWEKYCLSVIYYLVLTPSQTQRCQYCLHNAPSSQALILYFAPSEREREREKKTHFLHLIVSCFCLTQTGPCLAVQFTCPVAMRAVVPPCFVRVQSTVHLEDKLI